MKQALEVWADLLVTPRVRGGVDRIRSAKILLSASGRVLKIERFRARSSSMLSKRIVRAKTVIPGLVDCHTHMIFGGDRSGEWARRLGGATYQEIAREGGGILKTIRETRNLDSAELFKIGSQRLKTFLSFGVTTLEIKTGYGLSLQSELQLLKSIERLRLRNPQRIFSTFMGAHAVPPEFSNSKAYVQYLIREILPKVKGHAEFQDVFCETGYFSKEDSFLLLQAGKRFGLRPKIHAHEFGRSGGVEVACRVGAVSADHLMVTTDRDLLALKKARVVPVLLPGTSFFLGAKRLAQGRKFFDMGLQPAIATDFNPGTNPTMNLPLCGTFAATFYGLKPEEVLQAQTLNAAKALGQSDIGALAPGFWGDFLCLESSNFEEIYYSYGNPLVASVYIAGKKVY